MTEATEATTYGKINLHLQVGPLREDGYHDLVTVFHSVDLPETVTLHPASTDHLTVKGFDAHRVPTDSRNLVWAAVNAIRAHAEQVIPEAADHIRQSLHLTIRKGVPVAGGMAGGSADAAAALRVATNFYFRDHPQDRPGQAELMRIAATIGADVPFCLMGGTALGTGKGEHLTPVLTDASYHWAIATNKKGLSTPKVFGQLDALRAQAAADSRPLTTAGKPDELLTALRSADPHQLAPHLANDLQPAAISLLPELRETLAAGKEAGALACIVSGSGPTIAMLCDTHAHAVDVATAVSVAGKASSTMVTTSVAGRRGGGVA
ncbi:MAG TPA: 4-(cytidine 5'-diphospho)-2-C-methyl-D-erythritol kinase [Candidatus Corynebacterium gallistercoris]|uniref:4-diphosphocytidyl-2-C-methyl-D-erythritol kinase n=1 Tax=Candidatus Corynebacterium gallistercoris TaxID=2838530 RepID=A0A9D1RZ25_9CORY|nr:4-(cytidine 5'-diphospho)-2-C-methyl-D-erythritol kinase [Candidatus Corynebacterium gallistercoris]